MTSLFGQLISRGVWSALLGVVVVATPIPFSALAFLLWAYSAVRARSFSFAPPWARVASRVIPVAVLGIVLLLALTAPKTVDAILDRRVILPKTRVTLGELQKWTEGPRPLGLRLAITVWMDVDNAEAAQIVEWPARELSLRQFIATIEAQTGLRGRFSSCGNGYTIWKGQDCCFGLTLRNRTPQPSTARQPADANNQGTKE